MAKDLFAIAAVIIFSLAIVVFMFIKNRRDGKELQNKLNQDYRKSRKKEDDIETDAEQKE
jgi:low affinity Fe/Cu permease